MKIELIENEKLISKIMVDNDKSNITVTNKRVLIHYKELVEKKRLNQLYNTIKTRRHIWGGQHPIAK